MSPLKPVLYSYWRSSCSYRVRIALNLKNISYETKAIDLTKDAQNDISYKKINPVAKIPALEIDGRTLVESLSIMQYLEETRPEPPLLPKDPFERAKVREICDIIVSGIQPLQNVSLLKHLQQDKGEWAKFWITKGFTALEQILSSKDTKYCSGNEITLSDICLVPQVYNAKKFNVDMKLFPRIVEIDKILEDHDAFRAAHPSLQIDCPELK